MLFWTIVKVAFRSLAANKLRSVLTMLGVIIGVASVIAMLGVGSGAERAITQNIRDMGSNLLLVRPGQRGLQGVTTSATELMTLEDAEALIQLPFVAMVSPEVFGTAQIKYANNNTRSTVSGCVVTTFPVRNYQIARGRPFTESEVNSQARVAVLGPETAKKLFGASDPLNRQIKVKGINFKVIGVLKAKGDMGFYNPDDQAYVPITVAMRQLFGMTSVNWINVAVRDGEDIKRAEAGVTEALRKRRKLGRDEENDFFVRNMSDVLSTMESVATVFKLLLTSVAGISLIVGGIGIMNIMLVTVTERTREIGVRKALGARDRDIMRQFLIEALVLSMTGGAMGIVVGVTLILGFNHFIQQFQAVVDPGSAPLAFLFSAAVGVFFGWIPAKKASLLDPIESLRYE